jgi:external thioesterase TEII
MGDKKLVDIRRMAEEVLQTNRHLFTGVYVLYGHSMGALLAYLVAQKIEADSSIRPPAALVVSGAGGPSVPLATTLNSDMPKETMIGEMVRMGGILPEVLAEPALIEYVEPIVRCDLMALESYKHLPSPPLSIPITLLYGDMEDMTEEEVSGWQAETVYPLNVLKLAGNHFFIFDHPAEMCRVILEHLEA